MEVLSPIESALTGTQPAWPLPPEVVGLAGGEVHVWSATLLTPDFDYEAGLLKLSDTEKAQSARFHFERDRKEFIARRAMLRGILGSYLNLEPSEVALAREERGKPCLSALPGEFSPPLHFNFSHSRNLAVLAVARSSPVGVDVERIRPMPELDDIVAAFCSEKEKARFQSAPPEKKLEIFFSIWTRKEAFLKGTGDGIAAALAELDCTEPPQPWSLHTLVPAPGFIGALAVQDGTAPLQCWQWAGR